jgi:hypothetical protein
MAASSVNLSNGVLSGVPTLAEDSLSPQHLFDVDGLVALITGGGSGWFDLFHSFFFSS